jgi:hypothetical protein
VGIACLMHMHRFGILIRDSANLKRYAGEELRKAAIGTLSTNNGSGSGRLNAPFTNRRKAHGKAFFDPAGCAVGHLPDFRSS